MCCFELVPAVDLKTMSVLISCFLVVLSTKQQMSPENRIQLYLIRQSPAMPPHLTPSSLKCGEGGSLLPSPSFGTSEMDVIHLSALKSLMG